MKVFSTQEMILSLIKTLLLKLFSKTREKKTSKQDFSFEIYDEITFKKIVKIWDFYISFYSPKRVFDMFSRLLRRKSHETLREFHEFLMWKFNKKRRIFCKVFNVLIKRNTENISNKQQQHRKISMEWDVEMLLKRERGDESRVRPLKLLNIKRWCIFEMIRKFLLFLYVYFDET